MKSNIFLLGRFRAQMVGARPVSTEVGHVRNLITMLNKL